MNRDDSSNLGDEMGPIASCLRVLKVKLPEHKNGAKVPIPSSNVS